MSMLARFLLACLVAASLTMPVTAQVSRLPEPGQGPDFTTMSLSEGLQAASRRELDTYTLATVLGEAGRSRDPAHIPMLKEIVDVYSSDYITEVAMLAIEAAGEPADYFLDYVRDWEKDGFSAIAAANVLAVRPGTQLLDEIREILRDAPYRAPDNASIGNALSNSWKYGSVGGPYSAEYIQRLAVGALFPFMYGRYIDGRFYAGEADAFEALLQRDLYIAARLYPSQVEAALVVAEDSLRVIFSKDGSPPDPVVFPQMLAIARERGARTVFPATAPPVPAAEPEADIRATLVCVEPSDALTLEDYVATFGYTSTLGRSVYIPYGSTNTVSGGTEDYRGQPEVFPTPEEAIALMGYETQFRIAFDSTETVTWTLPGGSATASAASPRCGEPTASPHLQRAGGHRLRGRGHHPRRTGRRPALHRDAPRLHLR